MFIRRILTLISVVLFLATQAQTRTKTLVRESALGKTTHTIKLLPLLYDSTITDNRIMQVLNTLPQDVYYVLFKDDTARYAATVQKLGDNYQLSYTYKNGNDRRVIVYNKELQLNGSYTEYYESSRLKIAGGNYVRGKKYGTWKYYNKAGELVRTEKYTAGTLKKIKDYNPPKQNANSKPVKANGTSYTLTN